MNKYDIAVIGGGMVGAAVAVGFAKQGRSVVLVEGAKPKAFDAAQAMDIRVSAISHQSVELLDSLGAWSEIKSMRVCPYRRLETDRKSTRLNSSHSQQSRMPSSA